MKKNNEIHKYFIEKEFQLTYDSTGNLVELYNGEEETKGDN